jgi:hypothetical protein
MKIFLLALLTAICFQSYSQVPQLISYQTVIRNTTGTLLTNQTVGMKISILQGSTTGTPVYVETQTPTTNINGLASIAIGGGTVISGSMTGISWGTGTYYIKTETDPTGNTNYTITGSSQLLSVPYALYAANSLWSDYAVYSELEPNAVAPQTTLIDSTWQTRQLNNTESSAGTSISRNGNQITLQPGKYHISASAQWELTISPGGLTSNTNETVLANSLLRLADNSNSTLLLGQAEHPSYLFISSILIMSPDNIGGNYSIGLDGIITVTSLSTITLQQYISYPTYGISGIYGYLTFTTNAGIPMSIGQNEIYTRMLIQKIN